MIRKMLRSLTLGLAALTLLAAFHQAALAGPPLICHSIEIGDAKSLPWAGGDWSAAQKDYDVGRLVDDTLALLASDMPVLVRMETLRRAAIYSAWGGRNLPVADELLARLVARGQNAKGKAEALALFDAGYFVECCKQSADPHAQSLDGYGWVVKAISLRGGDAEMEFAAAIISWSPPRPTHREHLQKATAGAAEGSLLARNLASRFGNQGKTAKN